MEIFKKTLNIPDGVVLIQKNPHILEIKGPFKNIIYPIPNKLNLQFDKSHVTITSKMIFSTELAQFWAYLYGSARLFKINLRLVGIGYKAYLDNDKLCLVLGYSHTIYFKIPAGLQILTPKNRFIVITGANYNLVTQVAARLRNFKRPDIYKGKGILYITETLNLKEGKKKK